MAITVEAVTLHVDKSDKDRRMGIATDSRERAKQFCSERFGWVFVETTVVASQERFHVITARRKG